MWVTMEVSFSCHCYITKDLKYKNVLADLIYSDYIFTGAATF